MTLKVAIIGLGGVSEAHLSAYPAVEGIKIVAAAEPRKQRLDEVCALYGLRGYADYQEMLDSEDLDIACVLVPASLHQPVTEACAAAGVHVFCEKPIAIELAHAEAMVAACDRHAVKFFYGASYRFLPAIQKARELIKQGLIGKVMLMTESVLGGSGAEGHSALSFSHYPEGGPGGSGMGLVDHGIHMIDLFPWLSDSTIVDISGMGNISGAPPATEYVHMALANGAVGQLLYNDCTFDTDLPVEGIFSHGAAWDINGSLPANSWHAHPGCIRVYGSRGSLRIFHYANYLFLNDHNGICQVPLPNRPPPAQFALQTQTFVDNIRNDQAPEVSGLDGIRALRALLAVYDPARPLEAST